MLFYSDTVFDGHKANGFLELLVGTDNNPFCTFPDEVAIFAGCV
jgi:hypothetical protein